MTPITLLNITFFTTSSTPTIIVGVFIALIVAFFLSLFMGNKLSLKLISKTGISILTKKPEKDLKILQSLNKDTLAILDIPNVCYNPVYLNTTTEDYSKQDYLKRPFKLGELYINKNDKDKINEDQTFKDLTIINGSSSSKKDSLNDAKFTFLKKYTKIEVGKEHPLVNLHFKNQTKKYALFCALEVGIENRHALRITNKDDFLNQILKMAYVKNPDTINNRDKEFLILRGGTDLDTLLVFLTEVKDNGESE